MCQIKSCSASVLRQHGPRLLILMLPCVVQRLFCEGAPATRLYVPLAAIEARLSVVAYLERERGGISRIAGRVVFRRGGALMDHAVMAAVASVVPFLEVV